MKMLCGREIIKCRLIQFLAVVASMMAVGACSGFGNQLVANPGRNANLTAGTAALGFLPAQTSYTFPSVPIASIVPVSATFLVINMGIDPATNIVVSPLPAPFTITNNTCASTSLASSSSCEVMVSFLPTSATLSQASLNIRYDGGTALINNLGLTLQGTGTNTPIGVLVPGTNSTNPFSFGQVPPTTTATKIFNALNMGNAPVTIQTISLPIDNTTGLASTLFSLPSTVLGITTACAPAVVLQPNGVCQFAVSFNSPATSGTQGAATVSFVYNNGPSQTTLAWGFSGSSALNPATLAISNTNPASFVNVSASINAVSSACITLTNISATTPVTGIQLPTLSGPFAYSAAASCLNPLCGTNLAAAGLCDVGVQFSPGGFPLGTSTIPFNVRYNLTTNTIATQNAILSGNSVYFADNFNRPDANTLGSLWNLLLNGGTTTIAGNWGIASGKAYAINLNGGNNVADVEVTNLVLQNLEVLADIDVTTGNGANVQLFLRNQGSGYGYGYQCGMENKNGAYSLSLAVSIAATRTVINHVAVPIGAGTLDCVVNGNTITGSFGGVVLSTVDSQVPNAGAILMRTLNAGTTLDNFIVRPPQ